MINSKEGQGVMEDLHQLSLCRQRESIFNKTDNHKLPSTVVAKVGKDGQAQNFSCWAVGPISLSIPMMFREGKVQT